MNTLTDMDSLRRIAMGVLILSAIVFGVVNGGSQIVAEAAQMPCVGGVTDIHAEAGAIMEKANARLIAAAPDLLAALKGILESNAEGPYSYYPPEFEAARAAVAKATGHE